MKISDIELITQILKDLGANNFSIEASQNSLSFNFLDGERIVFSSYARKWGSQISICGFGPGDRNRNYFLEDRYHVDILGKL
jgi:hypothetical protein